MTELRPTTWASRDPERAATVHDSGAVLTYRELEERSTAWARGFDRLGLQPGDHVALLLGNDPEAHELLWAAQRAGLFFTPVGPRLTPSEAAYIINDCGARATVATSSGADLSSAVVDSTPAVEHRLVAPGDRPTDATSREGELEGVPMTYSSGTTGRPKGVLREFRAVALGSMNPLAPYFSRMGVGEGSRFLVPTPLYHAMSLHWSMALHRIGATCVLMQRFDAERCLDLIEEHRITHGIFVPTMFVRLMKLPEARRAAADVSSLVSVIHSAAPCPVDVKRRIIEWWGPVVHEFYGASEGGGASYITSEEWLAHPGSVGRPLVGTPHACDDDGNELPVGEAGVIWFENAGTIGFHNAPEQSRSVVNDRGWVTFWDIGYLDGDGYLYLTDRKQFMIVSGGVNIYPQEVEDVLIVHPAVADVAVFGVPHDEFGEEVKAVVQLAPDVAGDDDLAQELIDYCRERLAHYKCPRSVDFEDELPRTDAGKLYKRILRDRYWSDRATNRVL